jgi:DNA-binding transcriptional MocR family regulator
MSLEARQQLVAHASHLRIPILEDDVFGELRYDGAVLPSLKSLASHLVIYIGSFSKMLTPGLRVGWVVAPRPVIRQLRVLKQATDLQTSLLVQAALDEFCRRDLLHRHLKRVRRIFVRRRDAMADALKRHFPKEARWQVPAGGLSMWVSMHPEFNAEEFLRLAQDRGVEFLPGSAFYFRSPLYNSLRLSFAAENETRIQEGVRLLGSVLRAQDSRSVCTGGWIEPARPPIM